VTEGRLDSFLLDAFVVAPPIVAVGWVYLLTGTFSEALVAVVWVILVFALRPLIWWVASDRESLPKERAALYRERERNAVNTAFAATVVLGLGALDVVRFPGAPYWTNQPRASFALVAVVVYLVWLSRSASIPAEVRDGWVALLGRGKKGTHA
jgi:hypothetical protein